MEIKGLVHEIGVTQNLTDTFKKRDLIIDYGDNAEYREYIKVEALQDKVNLFDSLKVGQEVEVFFNLRGRPYTDKAGKTTYFNSLVAWRVNTIEGGEAPVPMNNVANEADDDDSTLPF